MRILYYILGVLGRHCRILHRRVIWYTLMGAWGKKNVKRQVHKQEDQLGSFIGVQWEKKEAGVRVIMVEVGRSSKVEGIFWNYSLKSHLWLCSSHLVTVMGSSSDFTYDCDGKFPRAHPHLCYFSSTKGATPLGLLAGNGECAGDIITLTQPSTNRALEPHECFSLLSSMWKILEGVPCTSQRSNLYQQPRTQPHHANLSSFPCSPH